MKANELQIGDWVYSSTTRTKKIKVENIFDFGINFQQEIFGIQEEDYIDLDDIEPIPLTAEILEANGFKKSYTDNMNAHYSRSGVGVTLNLASYTTTIMGKLVIIRYVHELQHALKQCGLSELANNFKLKSSVKRKLKLH